MTAAARLMAPAKFLMLRSKRVAMRPVLEAAEHPLDDIALFADRAIVIVLDFAVLERRMTASVPRSSSHSHKA